MTELSSPGVDEQPFWLAGKGVQPDRVLVVPKASLLRYDSPPWMADQALWKQRQQPAGPHSPSPLHGVSTQEVIEALGAVFSPEELDWELVGVVFEQPRPDPTIPAPSPVEAKLEAPPWADAEPTPHAPPAPAARAFASRKPRKWLSEHDEIAAAVRDLSWEGYCALVADILRREGYQVFGGEGPDSDVIDMEVVRGPERTLVSCQLRGLDQIGAEPLNEMAQVAGRNGADSVYIISDGDFTAEAWALADEQGITLIDREILIGLVLELTVGAGSRTSRLRRLLSGIQAAPRDLGLASTTQ